MVRRASGATAVLAVLVVAGCSNPPPSPSPSGTVASAASPSVASSAAPSEAAAQIPQPSVSGVEVADLADRVDLAVPTFSNPTEITNPLFPIALQSSNLLVGTVEDKAFRTEVTVLPWTQVIEWEGQQIEAVVSQYNAFLDGRIEEIAYDLYAQADDGSVWYFGEDVFNFADGAIVDTARNVARRDRRSGRDDHARRPAGRRRLSAREHPRARLRGGRGPVDRRDASTGRSVPSRAGSSSRSITPTASTETKQFVPGYGEFYTAADGEVEALAMAVPPDTASGSAAGRADLGGGERLALRCRPRSTATWDRSSELAADLDSAIGDLGDAEIPALLRPLLTDGIDSLSTAASDGDEEATTLAAIDVARLVNDLTLRYRPIPEVDLDRIGLWGAQLILDAGAEDLEGVRSDNFAVDYARERIVGGVPDETVNELNATLEELQIAIDDEDFAAIAEAAQAIRDLAGDIGS